MALIVSISGIRGTIGGTPGGGLTPVEITGFASAYAQWLRGHGPNRKIVVGRDARLSGAMVHRLVCGSLNAMGFDVIDLGLSTTPTVEMAVTAAKAAGGIILTASHNPKEWNALKLLNAQGEFISQADGAELLKLYQAQAFEYATVEQLGQIVPGNTYTEHHLEAIRKLPLVDPEAIDKRGFKVVVDGINSSGALFVPMLLRKLYVNDIVLLNEEPNGRFAHNPEPLAKHLGETCAAVKESGADLGIVVDPDVDRLALIDERGELIGEEYTLVAVADYILQHTPGPAVSNLSSSRALRDLCEQYGVAYHASAVGEVNVVAKMKQVKAVIGGEGNGGIIVPELHYGRDALVGIALILSYLAKKGGTLSVLRASYPSYYMAKEKVQLQPGMDVDALLEELAGEFDKNYPSAQLNRTDGVKIDLPDSWLHLRKSNTEPIIRVYTEAKSQAEATALAASVQALVDKHL